jgi:hypothetical protein
MNDAEIEAAVRAELPWLLERRQAGERAAAEDTVSGRLRRAVKAMRLDAMKAALRERLNPDGQSPDV